MSKTFQRIIRSFLLSLVVSYFPLIALWKNNLGQIATPAVTINLLYTFLYVLIVFAVWLFIVRSPEKTALLTCVTSVFVFSFGHLFNLVGNKILFGTSIGFLKLFLVWFILFTALSLLIIKTKRSPDLFFLIFPVGLLIIINTVSILSFSIQAAQAKPNPQAAVTTAQNNQQDRPDIYYIILDAYARSDILKEIIGYDNTPFLNALKERGFYLPECALSNYDGTALTVTSVLNYDTLENMGIPDNRLGNYQASNANLIHDSKASQTFRSYGYQFVTGRGYSSFNDITTSDVYLNYGLENGINDDLAQKRFTSLYLNTTVFRVLAEMYKNNPEKFSKLPFWLAVDRESDPSLMEANFWYLQNNYMFDALEKFPEKPGSYFVYAHINAPHGPFVYRRDGSFRFPLNDQSIEVRYADAITYINQRTLELVDVLQKKSNPAPIIIIQGDHSIHALTTGLNKHKILSAYYLPGNLSTPPYKTITPVNNFRLILRNYFDPSIQLLPDTLWVKHLNDYQSMTASCDLKP